jgi:hypothetical protein
MPLAPSPASVSPRWSGEVAHVRDLRGKDDGVVRLAAAFGQLGRAQRALAHRLQHHLAVGERLTATMVRVHERREQRAVQRAPVDADAHRLPVRDRHVDHAAEVVVVLLAHADVAGVDPVLVEPPRALRVLREQRVAVVVEVAHDRHVHAAVT